MLKSISLFALCSLLTLNAKAQDPAKYSHIIGIQANPLLHQILSFGNPEPVSNPYLLRYSFRENEKMREYSFGIGYSLNTEKDQDGLESINNTIDMRLGWYKVIDLGKNLEVSLGGDLIYGTQNIRTFNIQAFNFGILDSTITKSTSVNNNFGLGPRIKISYSFSKNLSIGTEANYYFRFLKNKTNVLTENFQGDGFGNITTTTNTSNAESSAKEFQIDLPIALFLVFRF